MKRIFTFTAILTFTASTYANTVLITGANRGLGLEFAKQYQAKGYKVIATARKPLRATELNTLGVQVETLDVTNDSSVSQLKARLKNKPIDILINNAGIMGDPRTATILETNPKTMLKTLDVNCVGPYRVTIALLPNLKAGKEKKIINISSQLGSITNNSGGYPSYRASKAALNQITKSFSIALKDQKMLFLAMHPGWVRTDMGGSNATFSTKQSISAMIKVIDKVTLKDSGHYLDLNGNTLPW